MPSKTLYLKDSDLPLWEKAQTELGESLSALFADCLRERLSPKRSAENGKQMERIVLTLWNKENEPNIKKAFSGRWLTNEVKADDDQSNTLWHAYTEYSVAETQRGRIVVYMNDTSEMHAPKMIVYESFSDMEEAEDSGCKLYPRNLIAEVAAALDEPYEIDLDI